MTVYLLTSCETYERDVIVGVFATLEAAQTARPGTWRAVPESLGGGWDTRPDGWGGLQWHAIEAHEVQG